MQEAPECFDGWRCPEALPDFFPSMLEKLYPGIGLLCRALGELVWPCWSWGVELGMKPASWSNSGFDLSYGETSTSHHNLGSVINILTSDYFFFLPFPCVRFIFLLSLDSLIISGAWPLSNVGSCVCQCWHPNHVQLHSAQTSAVRRSNHLRKNGKKRNRPNNLSTPNTFHLRTLKLLRTQLAPF